MNTTTEKRQEVDYSTLDTVNVSFRRPAKWYMYVVKRVLALKNAVEVRARPCCCSSCQSL